MARPGRGAAVVLRGDADAGAAFSADGRYRYRLWRRLPPIFASKGTLLFVLLNPSKADERVHDPTSRRCVGYAFRWGYERVEIGNLFAWCATDPRALLSIDDPIGPWGDQVLTELAHAADRIVVGWGAVGQAWYRARQVERILRNGRKPLFALRVGAKGAPTHPLYVPAEVEPVVWPGCEP